MHMDYVDISFYTFDIISTLKIMIGAIVNKYLYKIALFALAI